jgi:hypothetical protein
VLRGPRVRGRMGQDGALFGRGNHTASMVVGDVTWLVRHSHRRRNPWRGVWAGADPGNARFLRVASRALEDVKEVVMAGTQSDAFATAETP